MAYYSIFTQPAEAQQDDRDILRGAIALAEILRDGVNIGDSVFLEGISKTICDASGRVNHTVAGREMWRFGRYLADTHRDDLGALICDYLTVAQKMIEAGYDA